MSKIAIVIIAILIIGAGIFFWISRRPSAPYYLKQPQTQTTTSSQAETTPADDTTRSISRDADAIDLGSIDKEFETIDKDLQGL